MVMGRRLRRWTAQLAVVATVAAGLSVSAVVALPSAPALAAGAISCTGGTIYGLDTANPWSINGIDESTGAKSAVGTFTVSPNASLNGLALTYGGTAAYAITNVFGPNVTPKIYRWDATTGATTSYNGPTLSQTTATGNIVMGGINPATGIYYFGFASASGVEFYGFDTNTNTAIPGRIARITNFTGGNGDLVFDRVGRAYFVATSGNGTATANPLVSVDSALPTTGSDTALTGTVISYLSPLTATFNGIAFDVPTGYLYVSGAAGGTQFIDQINPSSGALVANHPLTGGVSGATNVDLASCTYNNSLTVQKNIVNRYAAGDQFTVTVTGGGLTVGNTGTTSGATTGVQTSAAATAGPVIPLSGTVMTISETAAGTTDLSNYTTTWRCVNALNTGEVIASGTGTSGTFNFPTPTTADGYNVACYFTNDPPVLTTTKAIATVNGAAATATTQLKPGDVVVYNITVTNTGGHAGTTTLSDAVPANTTYTGTGQGWSCATGSVTGTACTQAVTVAANSSATRQYTLTVNSPLPANTTTIANSVTTSYGTCSSCSPTNPTVPVLATTKTIVSVNGTAATTATPVKAGDVIVYALATTNTGGSTGTTTLSDPVPTNTTYTGTGQGWSCTSGAAAGTACTQSVTVAAGATSTVNYTLTVNTPLAGGVTQIANNATSSTGSCPSCTVVNPTAPSLAATKTIVSVNGSAATTATPVKAGDVVVYQIAVTNTGGSTGTTTLSDPVPANTTYTGTGQGWSCATGSTPGTACTQTVAVAPGATANISYTVTVSTPLPAGVTQIANNVTSSTGTCASCSVVNPTVPTLDAIKTITTVNGAAATTATQLKPGDVVVYTITVTNIGGSTGTTTLSDPVPANTTYTGPVAAGWSCATGSAAGAACTQTVSVPANSSVTRQYTLTVNAPLPSGTTQIANNVASSNGTCSSCTVVNPTVPVLTTTKAITTVNGAAATTATQLKPGDVVVYTITVTNTGGSTGTTTLSDPVPANTTYTGSAQGWSCATGAAAGSACGQTVSVAAGATSTLSYTLTVNTPLPSGTTQIANNVTSSTGTCPTCTVINPTVPVLNTVKAIGTVNGAAATAATQVKAGDVVVYRISVSNSGGSTGSTTVSDPVPANTTYTGAAAEGWSCPGGSIAGSPCAQTVSVAAGAVVTLTYTVTLVNPLPSGTQTITNSVTTSTGTCTSCAVTNPTAPVLDTVKTIVTVNGAAASPATQVAAGDVIVYQIAVSNTGGSTGTTVLTDPVPANTTFTGTAGQGWSCATGSTAGTACTQTVSVPANASVTRQYTLTVNTPIPAGVNQIANTVATSTGTCSACSVTNPVVAALTTAKAIATVNGAAATASAQLKAGDVLVYTITVTNTGGSSGTTTLSDPVPANTTYTGAAAEGWSCATGSAAGTACAQTVSVPANSAVTRQYTLTVNTPLPAGVTQIANNVSSSTGSCAACSVTNPTVPALNTVKTITTVNGAAASTATQLKSGDVVVYTITVNNTGGSTGTTTLSDPVPANTTYTGAAAEGWSCASGSAAGTACTQTVTAAAGATATVTYTLTVTTPLPAGTRTIANSVTSTTGTCSSCTVINPTVPDLSTAKAIATVNGTAATTATQLKAGDVVVYTITVTNTGGSTGTTTLSDPVPANTTYTGAAAEGWSCASGSAAGTACTQTVTAAAGATATVTYMLTVVTPLPVGTRTIANNVSSSTGSCASCAVTNPTVPVLDTVKALATVNGAAASTATQLKAGDVVVYTIAVTNTGGSTGATTLTDDVPTNTTYTGAAAEGWSCPGGSVAGTTCTQAVSVASGATVTVPYTLTIASPLPSGTRTIANSVTTTTGTCSDCTAVNPTVPVLDTVKTISTVNGAAATTSTQLKAGDVVVYTITVTNTGGSTGATTLTDDVPTNTTYTGAAAEGWSCATGAAAGTACTRPVTVAAGSSVGITYTITVISPLPTGTQTIANSVATSTGTCSACTVVNPTVPALSTAKVLTSVNGSAATAATQVKAGDILVYTITATNTGGSTGTTTLTDDVPVNTTYTGTGEGWSCASGAIAGTVCTQDVTVAANDATSVTYTMTVVNPLPPNTTEVGNTVGASPGSCPSCSPTNPTSAVLDTVKTITTVNGAAATPSTQVQAGDVVVYTITVTNTGGSSGTTTLSDAVPVDTTYTGAAAEGWSCASGATAGAACTQSVTVAPGATGTVTYTLTVVTPLPAGTRTIANTVATSTGTCSACTVVNPTVPALDTVKTITSVNGAAADPTTQLAAGDVVVYTITVTNTGGSTGTTTLTDNVPANATYTGDPAAEGWSCPTGSTSGTACTQAITVPANDHVDVSFTMTIVSPLPANVDRIANNVATTSGTCSSCTPTNPTVAALDTVKTVTTVNGAPATASTQLAGGDIVVYTITVTNSGGVAATTTLTDAVPANTRYTGTGEGWSCTAPAAAGTACTQDVTVGALGTESVTYTLTVSDPLPADTKTVANSVTSSRGTCSSCDVVNPTAPVLTTVKTITTVNGATASTATQLAAGNIVVYTITVTNSGGSDGTTTLTDKVPANTIYTGDGEGWSCVAGAGPGTSCMEAVTVTAGNSVAVTYTVTVSTIPDGVSIVTNLVTTSSGDCPSCTVNNPVVPPSNFTNPPSGPNPPNTPELPFTGTPVQGELIFGGLLLAVGLLLVVGTRRRRRNG
jgi:uncharacterized repeat protein (TIGR01451 family)